MFSIKTKKYSFLHSRHLGNYFLLQDISNVSDDDTIGQTCFCQKGSDCPILASYQMWFGQKLLKKAQTNSKIMKIFGQKLFKNAKKLEMADFGATRSGFHKNSQIFTILLLVLAFLSNFWPNHIW